MCTILNVYDVCVDYIPYCVIGACAMSVTFWVGHLPAKWQKSQARRSLLCRFLSNVRRSLYLGKKVMRYYHRDLRGHHLHRYLAKCKADYNFTSQTLLGKERVWRISYRHYFPHAWRVNRLTSVSYSTESLDIHYSNTLLQVGHHKREDSSQGKHVTSVHALL